MMKGAVRYPLTVYYDASCPMCSSEIHALRALDREGRLRLSDCSAPGFRDDVATAQGVTTTDMMRRIHARDADGRWLVGLDCFEAIYRASGLEGVARVWGSPLLRPLLDALYAWVATHRQLLSRMGMNALVRCLMPGPRGTR